MTEAGPLNSDAIRAEEQSDFCKVINHLVASCLAGRGQLWLRADLVQPHKPGYFKPDSVLYRKTLKKDRKNGKELEYIHSSGTWIEQAICCIELFKSSNSAEEQGRLLFILESSLRASKEPKYSPATIPNGLLSISATTN